MQITLFDSLRHVDRPHQVGWDWPQVVTFLSTHAHIADKESAPGFGPYALSVPVRKTENVYTMAMAVFDVDHHATPDAVAQCRDLMVADDLAQHWYTTHSHSETKPSWRLVLPLASDWMVSEEQWRVYRRTLIARYAIPADARKCVARAHFYFVPSCPTNPTTPPTCITYDGRPLECLPILHPRPTPVVCVPDLPSPMAPVDLGPLKTTIRARIRRLRGSGHHHKADALEACLNGDAFAEHGSRNATALMVSGVLAYAFPDEHPTTLYRIMQPSVELMISRGSRLTRSQVLGMIERARANYYRQEAESQALRQQWENDARAFYATTPSVP